MKESILLLSLALICTAPEIASAQASIFGEDERARQFAECVGSRLDKVAAGTHFDDEESQALLNAAFKRCKPNVAVKEIAKQLRAQDPALEDDKARTQAMAQITVLSTMVGSMVLAQKKKPKDAGPATPGVIRLPAPPENVRPDPSPKE